MADATHVPSSHRQQSPRSFMYVSSLYQVQPGSRPHVTPPPPPHHNRKETKPERACMSYQILKNTVALI